MTIGELGADLTGTDDGRPLVVLLHGLTFDRGMWAPLISALDSRRVLAVDLPGHGDSPVRDSYDVMDVVDELHAAIMSIGAGKPVLVGHSIGGLLATVYAGRHPARAVLNIDQPLLPGPFGEFLRSAEQVLRGPDYVGVWNQLLAGMGVEHLSRQLRDLVRSKPRQDLLLGYWSEILEISPVELRRRRTSDLHALREFGTAYHHISRTVLDPGYEAWFRKVIPEAGITVLAGSGHFPHLGQPDLVAEIVSRWQ